METRETVSGEPTAETLAAWADEGGCRATDGCWLEHGERECTHGAPSWAVVLGVGALEPE